MRPCTPTSSIAKLSRRGCLFEIAAVPVPLTGVHADRLPRRDSTVLALLNRNQLPPRGHHLPERAAPPYAARRDRVTRTGTQSVP